MVRVARVSVTGEARPDVLSLRFAHESKTISFATTPVIDDG